MTLPVPANTISAPRKTRMAALFLAALGVFTSNANAQVACDAEKGSVAFMECLHKTLDGLRTQLDQRYQRALSDVPDFPRNLISDSRKERSRLQQNLAQSQAAWQTYADESCAYAGGVRGGSGGWISIVTLQCLIEETKARIDRLEHLPSPGG